MRTGGVLNILGKLLLLLSIFLLTPIPFSYYYDDGMVPVFLISSMLGVLLGGSLVCSFQPEEDLGYRDGFAVVVFSWLGLALLGALPFYFSGVMDSFVDCVFESMSGFTTTGSTILPQVEVLPKSVLFWRSLTHWFGGMGIIVLTLAILPLLGIGGMQLFQAEMPGPTKDRLAPRIQDTARILWSVYVLFTVIEILLLMLGGVSFFDAVCHAFATLATGGFSTHTASIGFFNSAYIESVIIFFMFVAGINFSLHYQFLKGKPLVFWRDSECRFYLGMVLLLTLVVSFNLYGSVYATIGNALRYGTFQVVSIITTTGFATADYEKWPAM
ncbi:MAG: TrkH family potassium uptake protein, partial [Deltaproteobacteria bacterium]|nr:TrkH family potassium uptake protein [Deltaproteobacteria bacterium]